MATRIARYAGDSETARGFESGIQLALAHLTGWLPGLGLVQSQNYPIKLEPFTGCSKPLEDS